MTSSTIGERFAANAAGIAATTVTGTWLAALLLGFDWWLAFMLFGYIVIVPVVAMLFDEDDEETDEDDSERARSRSRGERDVDDASDALARLRTRYADGELTDEQFERKLDRLLETETLDDAAEWTERNRVGDDAASHASVETERETSHASVETERERER